MKNIPKNIYLQTGLEELGSVKDFNDIDSNFITWEACKIYSDDLEYISVDFILLRIKELEKELTNEDSIYSEARCLFSIAELKKLIK